MQNIINVWDLPLRISHWLLVLSFLIAYLTEDELLEAHVLAGYVVFAYIIFRVIWGFCGNHYARFSQFLCHPKASIQYLKDLRHHKAKRYLGHNPAGSFMIVLLLIGLFVTTLSGLAVYAADKQLGPLAFIDLGHESLCEEVHEVFANATLFLVFIHIAGVALESIIHKENLVKAMLCGKKRSHDHEAQ